MVVMTESCTSFVKISQTVSELLSTRFTCSNLQEGNNSANVGAVMGIGIKLLLAVPRRLFCFGSSVVLDMVFRYL